MGILGAAAEGTGEGVKKGAAWWAKGLLATVITGAVLLGAALFAIASVIPAVGLVGALVAGGIGAVAGAIGGGALAATWGAGVGAGVAGAGGVVGFAKGVSNHIKRDQDGIDKQTAQAFQERQMLIQQATMMQGTGDINPDAAAGFADREAARRASVQQQRVAPLP